MPLNQPLVTVGIPTYNRPEGLRKTLECITGQTYKNLEIIVSDNNSPTDESERIVSEFLRKDQRVNFYRQPENKGQTFNFLFVLEKAQGGYFMWAADDDWWAPEFVEKIMALFSAVPKAVAGFSNFIEVDSSGYQVTSYPDHLPLLKEFTVTDKVKCAKNFIMQYEGFGKANLFNSIFKTELIKAPEVLAILNSGCMPADMWVVLHILLQGRLALVPEVLRKCTVANPKDYPRPEASDEKVDLFLLTVNWGRLKQLHARWGRYLYRYFHIIARSNLTLGEKVSLYPAVAGRIASFYYDLVCMTFRLRGCNVFYRLKGKYNLE
jgi:glycosyltransferase involved in cell wall biosynthesis